MMSNSPLVTYTRISPNKNTNRKYAIDRITPHCVVGQCSVETLGNVFAPTSRQASSNYGIGPDGRIGMYCEEKDRSWCTSSAANDHRAITIECASDITHPYAMRDIVYKRLIELCVDICKRNGKTKLLWIADKEKALSYNPAPNEMLITVHRWFDNRSCPGDWLFSRLSDLANKVTSQLSKEEPVDNVDNYEIKYSVQVGEYVVKENAEAVVAKLKAAGYDAFIKSEKVTKSEKENNKQPTESFNIGDKVKLQANAPVYGTENTFSSWVYNSTLYVREINGSRAVISVLKTGSITGAVDKKYLTKI